MLSIEQFLYKKKHSTVHHLFSERNREQMPDTGIDNVELFSEEALTSITKWTACLHYKKVNPHIK